MISKIISENIAFKHVPATFTFIGEKVFYKILKAHTKILVGMSFRKGCGTSFSMGFFIKLNSKSKVFTFCNKYFKIYK